MLTLILIKTKTFENTVNENSCQLTSKNFLTVFFYVKSDRTKIFDKKYYLIFVNVNQTVRGRYFYSLVGKIDDGNYFFNKGNKYS